MGGDKGRGGDGKVRGGKGPQRGEDERRADVPSLTHLE